MIAPGGVVPQPVRQPWGWSSSAHSSPPARSAPRAVLALTARELEVLALAAEGGTNAEIAAALGLTRLTIKSHMARICRRIDARSREQAVLFGLQAGVIR